MTARTPSLFVIGAGAVGTGLATAFRRAGTPVLGLWGPRSDAARGAASQAGVAAFSAVFPELLLDADIIIVAVRDDAIAEVAQRLVTSGRVVDRHVLLHCSGAISAVEVFAGVRARVSGVGTLHPLRSFAKHGGPSPSMHGSHFGVEGDEVGRRAARKLVELLGAEVLELEAGTMALYHAACVLASNALVGLTSRAVEGLAAAGVPAERAFPALVSLMRGTLENVGTVGLSNALTGPIARGDVTTVERHLKMLSERAPTLLDLYRITSRQVVELAREKGTATAAALAAIEHLLNPKQEEDS